jgi:hypothetical protein
MKGWHNYSKTQNIAFQINEGIDTAKINTVLYFLSLINAVMAS